MGGGEDYAVIGSDVPQQQMIVEQEDGSSSPWLEPAALGLYGIVVSTLIAPLILLALKRRYRVRQAETRQQEDRRAGRQG